MLDYSIHYYPPLHLLIANFKYTSTDYEADMKAISLDEETRRWWKVTDEMQESFQEDASGSDGQVPWWTVCPLISHFSDLALIFSVIESRRGIPL